MPDYAEQARESQRVAEKKLQQPYIPQDVGSEDYATIIEVARKVTTENRWLKEQAEYLTWQLKQQVEQEKKYQEEIKRLRTYITSKPDYVAHERAEDPGLD